MRISKVLLLASAISAFASACAETSQDDVPFEDEGNDPLAQESSGRIPVGTRDAGRDAGAQGARDAGAQGARDAGTSGRIPTNPTTPTKPTTPTTPQFPNVTNIEVPDPNGLFFAKIDASGDGCPRGTWNARISPDGKAFTITFASYAARINPSLNTDRITIDCTLNIAMNSPSGLSYGVTAISYSGNAYLEQGVRGTVSAYYNFSGQRLRTVNNSGWIHETNKVYTGPFDDDFVYEDVLQSSDIVFSECRKQSVLNINTSLRVNNSSPARSGLLNLSAIDGNTASKLIVKFNTKPCRL